MLEFVFLRVVRGSARKELISMFHLIARRLALVSLFLFVFISAFFPSSTARAAVWTTTQSWTPEWEQNYQSWVATSWDKDFFKRSGFYQNVLMDCADTVYSMRLIFAAQNGLPFAIKDPTGGSGIISNQMSRWDSLPQASRLRQFLLYIFETGSTGSLPDDTYPVAVNRNAITSGALLLTDRLSHHSWTVKYISETGIPFLLFASRPARTVLFERFEFPSIGFLFPGGLKPERHAGFRAFRHPEDLKKPVWDVPGYSLEQYQIPVERWPETMQKRLQLKEETPEGRVTRLLNETCKGARERVEAVNQALLAQAKIGSRCMTAEEYDDLSTPNRDKRMKDSFEALAKAVNEAASLGILSGGRAETIRAQAESVLAGEKSRMSPQAFCPVEIAPGVTLTLGQVFERSRGDRMSNNPHDTLEMRWGLAAFPSSKARSCPVY
jgi:hypothetical protein